MTSALEFARHNEQKRSFTCYYLRVSGQALQHKMQLKKSKSHSAEPMFASNILVKVNQSSWTTLSRGPKQKFQ